jgi:hypothetical protein
MSNNELESSSAVDTMLDRGEAPIEWGLPVLVLSIDLATMIEEHLDKLGTIRPGTGCEHQG